MNIDEVLKWTVTLDGEIKFHGSLQDALDYICIHNLTVTHIAHGLRAFYCEKLYV